ncbi:hypothetical protein ABZ312_42160 [Streptomyces sp. NPDC006207]
MTEAEMVVAALTAGASAGLSDTARGAVHDLYAGLREAVRSRLARSGGEDVRVLDAPGPDPEAWRIRLIEALTDSGVEDDQRILAAARALLGGQSRTGGITVDACGAKGVQIGGTQHNTFN